MIKNLTLLKPNRESLNLYISLGAVFFSLGVADVTFNIFGFLPAWFSFFVPLAFCFLGLHLIRIEFSGNKKLDSLNKNINSNWFNAILTIFAIFLLIKTIPPVLDWLFFDATFIGSKKDDCTSDGACWVFINVWFERLMYGLYPINEIWRINVAFIGLILTVGAAFFVPAKIKKIRTYFLNFGGTKKADPTINIKPIKAVLILQISFIG